jgi:ElaB/YqjD/DUF883 family membrane-anchored ribosome-binding protein
MDRTRENMDDAAASEARSASDAAASTAERIGDSLEQGRAALAEMQAYLKEQTRECMRTTDAYVRDNPWQSIGIAAGIGLLVGLLIRRR